MGQQQLLLLVLGIVIVGLAVVAGINAFSENQERSTKDAIVNEAMRIATDVQAYKVKPGQLGGGGDSWPSTLEDAGVSGDTPWGKIDYSAGSGSDSKAQLLLQPQSVSEKAVIDIPANGGTPSLSSGGSDGDIWGTGKSIN
jgi:hypothetical protein